MQHLKSLLAASTFLLAVSACQEEDTTACTNLATVDLESAPDCYVVLSLDRGRRIIPTTGYGCGVGVDFNQTDSPYDHLEHGDRVRIGYSVITEIEGCDGIPYAYITCLEAPERQSDQPSR